MPCKEICWYFYKINALLRVSVTACIPVTLILHMQTGAKRGWEFLYLLVSEQQYRI